MFFFAQNEQHGEFGVRLRVLNIYYISLAPRPILVPCISLAASADAQKDSFYAMLFHLRLTRLQIESNLSKKGGRRDTSAGGNLGFRV